MRPGGNGAYVIPLPDAWQTQAIARYARQELHAQTAATLHDEQSSLSADLAEAFWQAFAEQGGEIVKATTYSGPVREYAAQLKPITAVSPDALFLPLYATWANAAAAQARQMGIEAALLGWAGWSDGLDEQAVRDGYYCTEFSALDPQVRAFVDAYAARFGHQADLFAAQGYDAAQVLLDAIEKAGSLDVAAVRQALLDDTFQGTTGPIHFDPLGQAHKNLALVRVSDGEQRFMTYLSP